MTTEDRAWTHHLTDGASRDNPGEAGVGIFALQDGKKYSKRNHWIKK